MLHNILRTKKKLCFRFSLLPTKMFRIIDAGPKYCIAIFTGASFQVKICLKNLGTDETRNTSFFLWPMNTIEALAALLAYCVCSHHIATDPLFNTKIPTILGICSRDISTFSLSLSIRMVVGDGLPICCI